MTADPPRISAHQKRAITELYLQTGKKLLVRAERILGNRHDAQEAVQETFLKVILNDQKLASNDPQRTWFYLLTILERTCFRQLEKRKRIQLCEFPEQYIVSHGASDTVWDAYSLGVLSDQVQAAIRAAKPLDRMILRLCAVNGYRYRQIAAATGLTEKNVSVRLARLRKAIRKHLLQGGPHGG